MSEPDVLRGRWMVAITVTLASMLEAIDVFIVNVALDHIQGQLSASVDEAAWVVTSYLAATAIVVPTSGWLTTRLGEKRLFLGSIALFTASSVLAGLAPTLPILVVARILQGLGGGSLVPVSQAILLRYFPGKRRATGMAIWGIGIRFGTSVGPTLGGWITDNLSWRWIFLINVPVGFVAAALAHVFLEEPKTKRPSRRVDVLGFGLLATFVCSAELAMDWGPREDWFSSPTIVACAALAAVSSMLFVLHVLRTPEPIVELRLFKDPSFALGTVLMVVLVVGQNGALYLAPYYVQSLMGYTATWAGLALSPGALATLVVMPVVGAIGARVDSRWMIAIGCILAAIAMHGFASMSLDVDFLQVVSPRLILGLGYGVLFVSLALATLATIPQQQTGHATALYNFSRHLASSVGVALVGTMLLHRTQVHQAHLVEHVTPYSTDAGTYQALVQAVAARGLDPVSAGERTLAIAYTAVKKQALFLSFTEEYATLGWFFLLVLPFVLLLRGARRRGDLARSR